MIIILFEAKRDKRETEKREEYNENCNALWKIYEKHRCFYNLFISIYIF